MTSEIQRGENDDGRKKGGILDDPWSFYGYGQKAYEYWTRNIIKPENFGVPPPAGFGDENDPHPTGNEPLYREFEQ